MLDETATDILVVDDLPEKLLVYRTILDDPGLNVVTAGSGEEALRAVLANDFAVILLDVQMPGGMSGFETAGMIRGRRRSAHTPIIFLTAFADEVRVAEGYAQGAVDYMTTPVVPTVLRAKVRVFADLYRMTQKVQRQADERIALAEERTKREAAEEATRRTAFLAEVSRALADSLDPDTTARTLVRQVVPALADLVGMTLVGIPGQPWHTKLAWALPNDQEVQVRWVNSAEAPADALRQAVDRALADGLPEVLTDLDVPYPDEVAAGREGARVRSAVVVPLRARGRTLGVLTLALGPSGRVHGPADLALAADLASRAAVALANAQLHRELEHADRQKNEFLSMLAHELRNPLAPIRNANEVLRQRTSDETRVRWAQGVIGRQITHLVRLVDDLLDVSRLTLGKIRLAEEEVDLGEVMVQAVEATRPLIDAGRHALEVSPPACRVRIRGDRVRLAQVFTNLLNNAAKYTAEGGRITMSAAADNGAVVVRIRDTGIGIAPEVLPTVFDLFTQANRSLDRAQGGLGIGLTLVRRLVELHGGTVEASSEGAGRGSEFVVRLPTAGRESGPARTDAVPEPGGPADPLRIAVIDDNIDGAESLGDLLHLLGHEVRVAHDGPTGLALACEFRPDVVLLDIGLPGIDGYEVARRLRSDASFGAVLVAVSGYGRDEDRRLAREAGFDHHFVKPVELSSLRSVLDTISVPRRV